jgi:hypothetical protein
MFDDLPREARDAVDYHVGGVRGFSPADRGGHAAFAGAVRGAAGLVFVKGVPLADVREAAFMRREAATLRHVRPLGPALLWTVGAGGWLLIGMEHIDGYHPDYAPGSVDLELVADAVRECSGLQCPDGVKDYPARFRKFGADASALAGEALIHADLNPFNVLIQDGKPRVVDWAFAARGAWWLEGALLLPWLMQNGHTPALAEGWAAERIPGFAEAAPLDEFTGLLAVLWRDHGPSVWAERYAATVRDWHASRHGC